MANPVLPTLSTIRSLIQDSPALVELFAAHPHLLADWVVLLSKNEAQRTLTIVLSGGDTILTVAHDGADVVESRVLVDGVQDGTIARLYWTPSHRTTHAALILEAASSRLPSATLLADLLGTSFDPTALHTLTQKASLDN